MTSTESEPVEWCDAPSPATSGRGATSKREPRLRALAERPGEWARWPIGPKGVATNVKRYANRLGLDHEAVTRRINGQTWLYARVLGEAGAG